MRGQRERREKVRERMSSLFDAHLQPERIEAPDADIWFDPAFYDAKSAAMLFDVINTETSWRQRDVVIYGRPVPTPRLTAWYGEKDASYVYSGMLLKPEPWTDTLLDVKARIEQATGAAFNSVLLNFYRSGRDSVSWHADDEPELGSKPTIASLSLGAMRLFQMCHKEDPATPQLDIPLFAGSLLVMAGNTQQWWKHRVPKTGKDVGARLNLTFRNIHQKGAI